jgi:hypothetical protein
VVKIGKRDGAECPIHTLSAGIDPGDDMHKWPYNDWTRVGIDAWALGMEASAVIGLRVARMAMGGAGASDEARLMLSEKMDSALELQAAMMTGQLGANPLAGSRKVLRHYRRKVKANRKRLG